MASCRYGIRLRTLAPAACLAVLMQALSQPACAEVRVSGKSDALIVEAREAPIKQVLERLRTTLKLNYRVAGSLDRVVTGTYTGSLQRVLSRLLADYNYVMRSSADGEQLVVFGSGVAGNGGLALGHSFLPVGDEAPALAGPPGGEGWSGTIKAAPPTAPSKSGPAPIASDVGTLNELPALPGSPNVQGWNDTITVAAPGPPGNPAVNGAPQAAPIASDAGTLSELPALPGSPDVEGWNGAITVTAPMLPAQPAANTLPAAASKPAPSSSDTFATPAESGGAPTPASPQPLPLLPAPAPSVESGKG